MKRVWSFLALVPLASCNVHIHIHETPEAKATPLPVEHSTSHANVIAGVVIPEPQAKQVLQVLVHHATPFCRHSRSSWLAR